MRTPGASGVLEANSGKYRKPGALWRSLQMRHVYSHLTGWGPSPPSSLSPLLCPSKGAGHESLPVIKPWFLSASVTPQGLRGQAKERADERSVTGGLANVQVRGVSFPTGAQFRSADRCLAGTKRVPFFLRDWRRGSVGAVRRVALPFSTFKPHQRLGMKRQSKRS